METIMYMLVILLRGLIIWQMGESVARIKNKRNKRLAFSGFMIVCLYILYTMSASVTIPAVSIFFLLGALLVFVGINGALRNGNQS